MKFVLICLNEKSNDTSERILSYCAIVARRVFMTTTVQQWGLSKSNSNRQEQITEVILTHFMIIYIMMIKANEKIQYFLLEQIKIFIYY